MNVLVNGSSVYFAHSTNATHNLIWFDWEGTNYISNIVLPEFPSLIILPLFMIATLLAVTVYGKKNESRKPAHCPLRIAFKAIFEYSRK